MNADWVSEAAFWKKTRGLGTRCRGNRKRSSPEILIFLMTLLVQLLIEMLTEMGLPW